MSIHHRLFDPLSHLPHAAINSRHPLPGIHRRITSSTAKNSPCHPQSAEPQQGTRASHSVARHARRRGSTPKTVQNIRPAAARGKKHQDRKLGPATVASLINTQPTQRLHHQATGPRGNIFAHPFGPHTFSSFHFVPSFYPFRHLPRSLPSSFRPARRKPTRRRLASIASLTVRHF